MSKQVSEAPARPHEDIATTTGRLVALKKRQPAVFWPWLGGLLVVGLVIVAVVTLVAWNWLNNVQLGIGAGQTSASISTLNIQRTATYADLNFTLMSMQSSTSFSDDLIKAGPTTVRVTLNIANPTRNSVVLAYYDIARLLAAGQQPITPTNVHLPASLSGGKVQAGWIDFPVTKNTDLKTLKLQLGNASIGEMLVTIPASGAYKSSQYNAHTYKTAFDIQYYFKGWQLPGYTLVYHLNTVEVSNSYNGMETTKGRQFYVLNFTVDNPNDANVAPGLGYDYIDLVLSGQNRTPVDSTLPANFKPGAHGVGGHVTYSAPANMHNLTVTFRIQAYAGQNNYSVNL